MSRRRQPNLSEKLAAALLQLGHVPYEDAKQMTAAQINSLYQFDHYPVRYENDGPTAPWNLVPRLIKAHREKTSKVDRPAGAKAVRIDRGNLGHRLNMLAKAADEPRRRSRIPSRPFQEGTRPLRSGSFQRRVP